MVVGLLKKGIVFILEFLVFVAIAYAGWYGYYTYKTLKEAQTDPVFQAVMTEINQDKTAIDILGSPIKPELLFFAQASNPDPFAKNQTENSLVIPVYGPKQTATLFVKLERIKAFWHYREMALQVDGYPEEINLLLFHSPERFFDQRYSGPAVSAQ